MDAADDVSTAPPAECYIRSLDDAQDEAARGRVLREACETLARAPTAVHAIGVTGRLTVEPGAANPLLDLNERLGVEFGFRSLMHIGHRSFTVHFSRPAVPPHAPAR
jgi:hypothetical protein